MSLVVTKGYLLARYDYGVFDEILVFLNQFGNRFTCLALGTRKITSKNARALLFGNYLEIELFYSSNGEKLSKLKKVVAINQIGLKYASNLALLTLGDVISKTPQTNKSWFMFYQDVLVKVLMDFDGYKLSIYIYLYFIKYVFKQVKIFKCKHYTENSKILWSFSFEKNGLVCTTCYPQYAPLTNRELQLIVSLNNIDLSNNSFFIKTYNINWQTMYLKFHNLFREYIKKINKLYKKQ